MNNISFDKIGKMEQEIGFNKNFKIKIYNDLDYKGVKNIEIKLYPPHTQKSFGNFHIKEFINILEKTRKTLV